MSDQKRTIATYQNSNGSRCVFDLAWRDHAKDLEMVRLSYTRKGWLETDQANVFENPETGLTVTITYEDKEAAS